MFIKVWESFPGYLVKTGLLLLMGFLLSCATTRLNRTYGGANQRLVTPTFDLAARFDSLPPYPELKWQWTVSFTPRNPFYVSTGRRESPEEAYLKKIEVEATLYDPILVEAWVRYQASQDSLAPGDLEKYRRIYRQTHDPEHLLRVELRLRSGFAEKSVDLEAWAVYLVDNRGTFYEPSRVVQGEISQREVEVDYYGYTMKRTITSSTADLYFPQITFYGHRIYGPKTRFLKLVFAYHRETQGEGIWIFQAR